MLGLWTSKSIGLAPVAYYEFPHADGKPEWKAAGGVLFGVSEAVSDFNLQVRSFARVLGAH